MADTTDPVAPAAAVAKPGYKTTEFWLTATAVVTGLVVVSGVIPATGPYSQVVGMIVGLLGALGYAVPRMSLKATQAAADTSAK